MGAFAPNIVDEAIEDLEDLITDMSNDKPWCMHAMQGAELLAIIKTEGVEGNVRNHMPVAMPNTISKVADKAILQECRVEYTRELMSQKLGVSVKFAAELLAMSIIMTPHMRPDHIVFSLDMKNAYNSMWRAAIMKSYMTHMTLRKTAPHWRAKLDLKFPTWAENSILCGDDGLQQGFPSSGPAIAFTIQPWARKADKRLAEVGGYARFGMDDGHLVGLREVIV
jgi:hypothetical protein